MVGWSNFGLARGKNGALYSIFGIGQAIAVQPFLWCVETFCQKMVISDVPLSFYVDIFVLDIMLNKPYAVDKLAHQKRFLVSHFNVFITALSGVVFFLISFQMYSSYLIALVLSVGYAFGSLSWFYANTFFSEPLAMLCVLISFYYLLRAKNDNGWLQEFCSGCFLGYAILTHLTVILFIPFFLWIIVSQKTEHRARLLKAGGFFIGIGLFLLILGYFNYYRFGHVLETGRTVSELLRAKLHYGYFVWPFKNILKLLFSWGKGLFFYCPIVLLGLWGLKEMWRHDRSMAVIFVGMILFRLFFIGARSDWHGGFCLGPRYLVMLIPFFILPIGYVMKTGFSRLVIVFFILCIGQQIYFSQGDIFMYFFNECRFKRAEKITVQNTPLFYLHRIKY